MAPAATDSSDIDQFMQERQKAAPASDVSEIDQFMQERSAGAAAKTEASPAPKAEPSQPDTSQTSKMSKTEADRAFDQFTAPASGLTSPKATNIDLTRGIERPHLPTTAEGLVSGQEERRGGAPMIVRPGKTVGFEGVHHELDNPGALPEIKEEPHPKVVAVSTGFGAPTYIPADNTPESAAQAYQINQSLSEGEQQATGVSGFKRAGKGLVELAESGVLPGSSYYNPPITQLSPEQRRTAAKAGTDIIAGAGEAALPLLGEGLAEPLVGLPAVLRAGSTAEKVAAVGKALKIPADLAAGYLASGVAGKVADNVEASPEAKEFWQTAAFWIPATRGLWAKAVGLENPTLQVNLGDQGKAAGIMGEGGTGAGVAVTPEGVTVAGKFRGGKSRSVTFGGKPAPAGPALEPTIIEGNAQPAPTEAEVTLGKIQVRENMQARMAAGLPPVDQPPPEPSPLEQNPEVSPEMVSRIGDMIAQLPPELRPQAMIEAHAKMAALLAKQGRIIGPTGEIHIINKPQDADKLAQQWLNEEVGRQDKAHEEAAKGKVSETQAAAGQSMAATASGDEGGGSAAPAPAAEDTEEKAGAEATTNDVEAFMAERQGETTAAPPSEAQNAAESQEALPHTTSPNEIDQFMEQHNTGAAAASYSKGDQVELTEAVNLRKGNGESKLIPAGTKATVEYAHPKQGIVRLRTEAGDKIPTGASKIRATTSHKPTSDEGEKQEVVAPGSETSGDLPKAEKATSEGVNAAKAAQKPVEKPETEPKYKFGSTQANIPDDSEAAQALNSARQRISKSDLAGDGADIGGNHVTVRYGIKGTDTGKIKQYLSQQEPFEATLGKTDKFPPSEHSDGAAPIIAPIEAPELHRINAEIEKHGEFAEPSFKEYRPHATVAYVAPEKADRYTGMTVTAGKKFKVHEIAITDRQGNQEVVKLKGKKKTAELPQNHGDDAHTTPSGRPGLSQIENGHHRAVRGAIEEGQSVSPEVLNDYPGLKSAQQNTESEREKYPGGRLVPQVGDEVYQPVAGFGGSPAYIHGVVEKGSKGNLRVRVTGKASLLGGGSANGKTYPMSPHWVVKGDPEIKRREDERKAKDQAERDERERGAQDREANIADRVSKYGQLKADDVNVGDVLEDPQGNQQVVREVAEFGKRRYIGVVPPENLNETPGSTGHLRGWRKVGHRNDVPPMPKPDYSLDGEEAKPTAATEPAKPARPLLEKKRAQEAAEKLVPEKFVDDQNKLIEKAINDLRKLGVPEDEARRRALKLASGLQPGIQRAVDALDQVHATSKTSQTLAVPVKTGAEYSDSHSIPSAFRPVAKNLPELVEKYDALGRPDYVAADQVKELLPGWDKVADRPALDKANHAAASKLARAIFDFKLGQFAKGGEVLLVTGPTGAGKTTATKLSKTANIDLVYEINLAHQEVAENLIDQILDHGTRPVISYVYVTPEVSARRRATRAKDEGRGPSIYLTANQHIDLPRTIRHLAEKYGDRIGLNVYDNSKAEPAVVPLDSLGRLEYHGSEDELYREQHAALDRLRDRGEITPKLHAQLTESAAQGAARRNNGELAESRPARSPEAGAQQSVNPSAELKSNAQAISGAFGQDTTLNTPTSKYPATFRIVEADDLIPSHNALTFGKNVAYPEGVQERTYHTSKEAQSRVIQQSQNYDPAYTVNTNPDAVNGPPVITPGGIVLGGNSRTMSTQRLYHQTGGEVYKSYLKKNAAQFGFSPEQVDAMKQPVLVRQIEHPGDAEAMRRLGSDLNRSMTGALGVQERAVSAGKSIKAQTLDAIGQMREEIGDTATLRDVMRQHGRQIIGMLVEDGAITERERPQLVDTATGGLSEEGKTFVERALLGSVVDDPVLMERVPKSILNKLEGSLAELSSLGAREDEFNIVPLVREALADHAQIAERGLDVDTYLGQAGMFGEQRSAPVEALVRTLAEKPTQVRAAIRQFAQDAKLTVPDQATLGLVEPPSAATAFNEAFKANVNDSSLIDAITDSIERAVPNVERVPEARGFETAAEGLQRSRPEGTAADGSRGKAADRSGEEPLRPGPTDKSDDLVSTRADRDAEIAEIRDRMTEGDDADFPQKKPGGEEGFATPAALIEAPLAAGKFAAKAVAELFRQDVGPALSKLGVGLKDASALFVKALYPRVAESNPLGRGLGVAAPTDAVDAIMKLKGERDRTLAEFDLLFKAIEKFFDHLPEESRVDFITRMQTGESQPNIELQGLADSIQAIQNAQRDQEQEALNLGRRGPELELSRRANYFHNRWERKPNSQEPDDERDIIERIGLPRRPLEGTKRFNKRQSYTLRSGMEAGGIPRTTNPIRVLRARIEDGMKFVTARRTWHELGELDLRKFVKTGAPKPPGFDRIDDKIAKVYFPAAIQFPGSEEPTTVAHEMGEWYVEANTARLLNNFLSVDHIRAHPLGRGLMWLKNWSTALELGISPFHAVYETIEAMSSQLSLGLLRGVNQGLRQGDGKAFLQAMKDVLESPAAPLTMAHEGAALPAYIEAMGRLRAIGVTQFGHTISGTQPHGAAEALKQWRQVRREKSIRRLLRKFPDLDQLVDDMFTGGMPIGMHRDYKLTAMGKTATEAWTSGNVLGAVWRTVPTIFQGVMNPLFNWYIPSLKYSLFLRLMSQQAAERTADLESGKLTRAELARQVVDSVENRFGEVNFDNLFLDRTTKTALQMIFRSVTWKLGFVREFAGAGGGQLKELGSWAWQAHRLLDGELPQGKQGGAKPEDEGPGALPRLDMRMSWVFSLVLTSVIIGSLLAKLLSGHHPWQWAKDEAKAKGEDSYEFFKQLYLETMHPRTGDLDSRGKPVRLSLPTGWKDLEHAADDPKKYVIGSVSTILSRATDIAENRDYFGNYVYNPRAGLGTRIKQAGKYAFPAPFTISNLQRSGDVSGTVKVLSAFGFPRAPSNLDFTPAEKLARSIQPETPHTPEELEQWKAKRQALKDGTLPRAQAREYLKRQRGEWLVRSVKPMSYAEAREVYQAADEHERAVLRPVLREKRRNLFSRHKGYEVREAEAPQ